MTEISIFNKTLLSKGCCTCGRGRSPGSHSGDRAGARHRCRDKSGWARCSETAVILWHSSEGSYRLLSIREGSRVYCEGLTNGGASGSSHDLLILVNQATISSFPSREEHPDRHVSFCSAATRPVALVWIGVLFCLRAYLPVDALLYMSLGCWASTASKGSVEPSKLYGYTRQLWYIP